MDVDVLKLLGSYQNRDHSDYGLILGVGHAVQRLDAELDELERWREGQDAK